MHLLETLVYSRWLIPLRFVLLLLQLIGKYGKTYLIRRLFYCTESLLLNLYPVSEYVALHRIVLVPMSNAIAQRRQPALFTHISAPSVSIPLKPCSCIIVAVTGRESCCTTGGAAATGTSFGLLNTALKLTNSSFKVERSTSLARLYNSSHII